MREEYCLGGDEDAHSCMLLYALTIFVSAFLLFQVQPVIAKMILPWFGGSAAVWTTCLLFFQSVLLLGYLYAYLLIRCVRVNTQRRIHLLLLAFSILLLPIVPKESWKPVGQEDPAWRILGLLAATVGLPYFLLSATGPLLQAWYARNRSGKLPYWLYALSNAGSMLALLSYPVVVEPAFSTRHQGIGWSFAYAGFAGLCATIAVRSRSAVSVQQDQPLTAPPSRNLLLLWMSLAACASALLLAITNHLSQNVAAVPLLWVLPLSLYLLSFVVCFQGKGWYRRNPFLQLLAVALGGMAYALSGDYDNAGLTLLIPLFCAGLLICCMVCHGELARSKPHPSYLASFYLMIALGGAVGGIFVGLVAPRLFRGFFELPIGLAGCAALVLVVLYRDPSSIFHRARRRVVWVVMVGLTAAFVIVLLQGIRENVTEARVMARNFYGGLRITEADEDDASKARLVLMNGTIDHGEQFVAPDRRRLPITYYGPDSGVGLALKQLGQHGPLRLGIVGLGVGTLASYGRKGDHVTFYEINPLVDRLARTEFTYLRDSDAQVNVVLGDARLLLEHESAENFDLLAVDAFTSDSIPVHLLTREAFALYFRHLKPGGVLAIHISNRFLDLKPVVRLAAEALGKQAMAIESDEDDDNEIFKTTWVLVSDQNEFFEAHEIAEASSALKGKPKLRVWTDDYSNLFRILKK